jgi:hypothetical protein
MKEKNNPCAMLLEKKMRDRENATSPTIKDQKDPHEP